jgi:Ser/Thr protein kinase RdoA (MazF antagonist)
VIELDSIPRFVTEEILSLAAREYGLRASATPLPSERDQNFLLSSTAGRFVLKIANCADTAELLDFQHGAMRRIAAGLRGCHVPELIRTRSGAELVAVASVSGARHFVRLMGWLEGEVLGERQGRSAALLQSIGEGIAQVDLALGDYTHPAMRRSLQWDLKLAGDAREHVPRLPAARRARVLEIFDVWAAIDWRALPHSVIHGDANDHNILIAGERMVGLLDFGDMVHSATVCDLAIALAYSVLHEPDPLTALQAVIRGYHRERPLAAQEQRALPALLLARLGASVCYSAFNRARNPRDAYQVVSEAAVWALLDALERYSLAELERAVAAACAVAVACAGSPSAGAPSPDAPSPDAPSPDAPSPDAPRAASLRATAAP